MQQGLGFAFILIVTIGSSTWAQTAPIVSKHWTFDTDKDLEDWNVQAAGDAAKRMPKPKIQDGKLYLLESWWKSSAAVATGPTTENLVGRIELSWKLVMNTGTEGAGFLWLDVAKHGADANVPEVEAWETPSLPRAFGVCFDASSPPNRDPFNGSGNTYDRPQHEVSLHWDGMEIVKKTTPSDFRDEKEHQVGLTIEFVTGGSEITLSIDDAVVFEKYFIASMTAYVGRPAFGARNAETAGDVFIDDLRIACRDAIKPPAPPVTVVAIDRKLNDAGHPKNEATVQFPDDTDRFGRIICTLRLDKPETRFDPWDRLAHVFVLDADDEQFEILRYVTPYHRGHVWQVDVSDFRPLLRGQRQIVQECGTQGEGWVVSVSFDFYPGSTDRLAYKVMNLWSGAPEVGNPDKPVSDFYVPRTVQVDEAARFAKVRMVVTGHGMTPNSKNAAEFMPIGRTLRVNDRSFYNLLWKTDNYLNPCRPQGGTWKYDRAGWAPGDVVRPWEVDVSPLLAASKTLRIGYTLDPYVNENRGKTWAPSHRTEAQLILYRSLSLPTTAPTTSRDS
jgi:hypothetical protein